MQEKVKKEIDEISRRAALEKLGKYGKYTALTALGTYLILQPQKAIASSPDEPGSGWGDDVPDEPGSGFGERGF